MAGTEPGTFGMLLRKHRAGAGLTQEELAERAGLSARVVSDLERGVTLAPQRFTVQCLADALGLSAEAHTTFRRSAREGPRSIPADHSSLRRMSAVPGARLPVQPTPFTGRDGDIVEVAALLRREDVRLLTLTGPGGIGKTRLGVQVAQVLLQTVPDGAWFVGLAPILDPSLVTSAIARALYVREAGAQPLIQRLQDHLRDKRLLLMLDNFEHLLVAADVVARLLLACPHLTIMVTSRAALRLSTEHEYLVSPLAIPVPAYAADLEALIGYDAVRLFVQRAQAVRPGFEVTPDNVGAIAEICCRLDGLPLGIELAAARLRLFPPRALLARLQSRLALLTGGPSDVPARQQTLRDTMDWSHELLSESEKILFARLAVFTGGCTLEAIEAICNPGGGLDIVSGMDSLVRQSLVRQVGEEEPHFMMLETIREYALDRLQMVGEADMTRDEHARHYLRLAEEGERAQYGPRQMAEVLRLDREHDNVRAALRWLLDRGDVERELRLAASIWRFWQRREHFQEGLNWLEEGLAKDGGVSPRVRESALRGAAWLAYIQGDDGRALTLNEECLELARQIGDIFYVRTSLSLLGMVAMDRARYGEAAELFQECLDIARLIEPPWYLACSLMNLGMAKVHTHEYGRATSLLEEAVTLFGELGDQAYEARSLLGLGNLALLEGDYIRATAHFRQSLRLFQGREQRGIAESLEGLAAAAAGRGLVGMAARLQGASEALFGAIGSRPLPSDHAIHRIHLTEAQARSDQVAWSTAWTQGQAMTLEHLIAGALQDPEPRSASPDQGPG